VDAAFPGPVFDALDEIFANGVLHHVVPLFRVFGAGADAVVEGAGLEAPCRVFDFGGEAAFPESNLFFDGHIEVSGRADEMYVVGHEEVVADQPGGGFVQP
jgi:hypothetical protein